MKGRQKEHVGVDESYLRRLQKLDGPQGTNTGNPLRI